MRLIKQVNVLFAEQDLKLLEEWRRSQREIPTRQAAIRHFVISGLRASEDVAGARKATAEAAE